MTLMTRLKSRMFMVARCCTVGFTTRAVQRSKSFFISFNPSRLTYPTLHSLISGAAIMQLPLSHINFVALPFRLISPF